MLHTSAKKKVLITGGSGFLGRHLAKELRKVHEVVVTYASHPVNIPMCQSVRVNLLQSSTLTECFRHFTPDVVVHAAAIADGGFCQANEDLAGSVNVTGTELLMRALPKKDALFLYISTDLVFDGNSAPYNEESEPHPLSVYGATKLRAENLVRAKWKNHVILRTALMYGDAPESTKGSFLQWTDKAFLEKEKVTLFSDEYRTPVYVKDVAVAVKKIIDKKGAHWVYHIGGPERMTRVEFGKKLAEIRGHDAGKIQESLLDEVSTGYPRARDVSLDSSRIGKAHTVKLTPVDEALREIYGKQG